MIATSQSHRIPYDKILGEWDRAVRKALEKLHRARAACETAHLAAERGRPGDTVRAQHFLRRSVVLRERGIAEFRCAWRKLPIDMRVIALSQMSAEEKALVAGDLTHD